MFVAAFVSFLKTRGRYGWAVEVTSAIEQTRTEAPTVAARLRYAAACDGGNTQVVTDLAGNVPHHVSPDAKRSCTVQSAGDLCEKTTTLQPSEFKYWVVSSRAEGARNALLPETLPFNATAPFLTNLENCPRA